MIPYSQHMDYHFTMLLVLFNVVLSIICRSVLETENKVDMLLADLQLVDEQHTYIQDLRLDQRMILRIAIEVLTKVSMIVLYDPFALFTPSMMMNVGWKE